MTENASIGLFFLGLLGLVFFVIGTALWLENKAGELLLRVAAVVLIVAGAVLAGAPLVRTIIWAWTI